MVSQTNTFAFECSGYKLVFEMQVSLADRMQMVGYNIYLNDKFFGKLQARKFMSMDEECYIRHVVAKKVFESLLAQTPPQSNFLVKIGSFICNTLANTIDTFGIVH
jgi:hypothetical protein